ncbi:MAG: hypothetical protein HZB76_04295 [Chlamydiae bacterium]|nr:hypothetical protein [Chlamydiota bacterium]
MSKRAAIFCSHGIGDGLLFFTLANNLQRNGFKVDAFHNALGDLQSWFKDIKINKYPQERDLHSFLKGYDLIIINSDNVPINKAIKECALKDFKEKSYDLHPSTCKGKKPPIGHFKFDIDKSVVQNLVVFCQDVLKLENVIKHNGILPQENLTHKKFKRVVIHPTSKDPSRNWPINKFLKLNNMLKELGYETAFIVPTHERKLYLTYKEMVIPEFPTLNDLATFIYESSFMIGNDSGIGHLASCLNIPTVTICASKRAKFFWRPDWAIGRAISACYIPNLKFLRLRKILWKYFISPRKVFKEFLKIVDL